MAEQTEFIWGAADIAKTIGRSLRTTYMLLETKQLPGAMKVGGQWCFAPSAFRESVRSHCARASA
jgi:hypothetical protein